MEHQVGKGTPPPAGQGPGSTAPAPTLLTHFDTYDGSLATPDMRLTGGCFPV